MADRTNPFLIAHNEKTVLTQQTAKRIQNIYKQSALDIEKRLRTMQLVNPSDNLKKIYLENLLKDIEKSSDSFNRRVQATIMSAGEQSGQIAIDAGNKLMASAGLSIRGAYSYIPRQQMEIIASGKLYGDKWSLSQAIWKSGLRTKSDIQNVVAKGLAENKSIKDIANDLTKYVDPTARKPWDWGKVYPGTAQKVDYNAQRLARTMIQHAYQTSLVQQQQYNPFCKGIIWHSVGIHGRTCEVCEYRDGETFPVNELPLDHPNGLCYFEPALDDMNTIADRLADWAKGGSDPDLDNYVAKAFNMNLSSRSGQGKTEEAKNSVSPRIKRGKSIKSAERKSSQKVVQGKDISATWTRRSDKFAFEIEDVISAQGFDGKPRLVSAEEFEKAVKESNFIAQRTYSAETQEILDAYRQQLYSGKWYVDCGTGGAQYGQGMYCAADYTGKLTEGIRAEMKHYQMLGSDRIGAISQENLQQIVKDQKRTANEVLQQYKSGKISKEYGVDLYRKINSMEPSEYLATYMKKSDISGARAYTETFTLDKSAKIVDYDKLRVMYDDYRRPYSYEVRKEKALKSVLQDLKLTKSQEKDYKAALQYYETGRGGKKQYEALKDSVSLGDLSDRIIEKAQSLPKAPIQDVGSFAAAKGYDAINATGHGASGSYTVILNRTKLIIKRP